jgi:hypothetical protein
MKEERILLMVKLSKKYWFLYIIGGVISIAVIYILFNINFNDSSSISLSSKETDTTEPNTANTKEDSIQLIYDNIDPISGDPGRQIHQIHEHYNKLLTYGNWKSFEAEDYSGWETEIEVAKQTLSTIDVMLMQVEDDALINDLNNAKELIHGSMISKNTTGLLYLHRIFHDLDIKYNNYAEKLWGYSHYKDIGRNTNKVDRLIKKLNKK